MLTASHLRRRSALVLIAMIPVFLTMGAAVPFESTSPEATAVEGPGADDFNSGDEARWVNGALAPPLPRDPGARAAAIEAAAAAARAPSEGGTRHQAVQLRTVSPRVFSAPERPQPSRPPSAPETGPIATKPNVQLADDFEPTREELMAAWDEIDVMEDPIGPAPNAPPLLQQFGGIDDTGLYPPSPDIAIGPNHVMQVTNLRLNLYDKCGAYVNGWPLSTFAAGSPADYYFDPKVIYDGWDGRWVVIFCGIQNSGQQSLIYLSVTQTDNPQGMWWHYAIVTGNPGTSWGEYPDVNVGPDGIYIASNQWSFASPVTFQGATIFVLQKSEVYAGLPASVYAFTGLTNPGDGSLAHTIRPAKMYDWSGTYWLANSKPEGGGFMTLWGITGSLSSPVLTSYNVPVGTYDDPPDAVQANGQAIDAGDSRLLSVAYQANRLWGSATVRWNWGEPVDRANLYLVRINTLTKSMVTQSAYGAGGLYYFYPGLDFDAWPDNRAVFCFSRCGPSGYLETRFVGWEETSGWGTSALLAAGLANYSHAGSPPWRWGNHCSVDRDLMDNKTLWMVGPFASNDPTPSWDTYIGAASFETSGALALTPSGPFVSTGLAGGPFTPSSYQYTLQNTGGSALTWWLVGLEPWQSASQLTGILAPGASKVVQVNIEPVANTYPPGEYVDDYWFANCYDGSFVLGRTELTIGAEGACAGATVPLTPPTPPGSSTLGNDEFGVYVTAIRDFDICAIGFKADLDLPQEINVRIYGANQKVRGPVLAIGSDTAVQPGNVYHYVPMDFRLEKCQEYDIAVEFQAANSWDYHVDNVVPYDCDGAVRVLDAESSGNPSSTLIPKLSIIGAAADCERYTDLGPPETPWGSCSDAQSERGVFLKAMSTRAVCAVEWEADFTSVPTEMSVQIYEATGTTRGALLATGVSVINTTGMRMHSVPVDAVLEEGRDYDIAVTFSPTSWACIGESQITLPYAAGPFTVVDGEQGGNPANTVITHFAVRYARPVGGVSFSLSSPVGGYPPPFVSTQSGIDYGIFVQSLIDQELYGLAWRADVPEGAVIGARVYERSGTIRTTLLSEGSIVSSVAGTRWHGIPVAVSLLAGGEYDFEIDITSVNEWRWWDDGGLPYDAYGVIRIVDGERGGNPNNTALIDMRMSACNRTATAVGPGPTTPPSFRLGSPYPNPISERATLEYSLDREGPISVVLYDALGRRVTTLLDADAWPAGPGRLELDATDLAAGVYFVKLQTPAKSVSRKITVVR